MLYILFSSLWKRDIYIFPHSPLVWKCSASTRHSCSLLALSAILLLHLTCPHAVWISSARYALELLFFFSEPEEAVGETRCFTSVKIQVKPLQCAAVDLFWKLTWFSTPPVSDLSYSVQLDMASILQGITRIMLTDCCPEEVWRRCVWWNLVCKNLHLIFHHHADK